MSTGRVDYDRIAPKYDERYAARELHGVAEALAALGQAHAAARVLEVGCGTGRWLEALGPDAGRAFGLDLSLGMLRQARLRSAAFHLVCGRAARLPFRGSAFHVVCCVNAFHHFDEPRVFLAEVRRLLEPGGTVAIIGMDPHGGLDRWYVYDYFEGTLEIDRARFPAREVVSEWLRAAGFAAVGFRRVEHILHSMRGREVLNNHFLKKHGTSQLALLADEAYRAGLARIEAGINRSEATGQPLVFPVDISLHMVTGRVP